MIFTKLVALSGDQGWHVVSALLRHWGARSELCERWWFLFFLRKTFGQRFHCRWLSYPVFYFVFFSLLCSFSALLAALQLLIVWVCIYRRKADVYVIELCVVHWIGALPLGSVGRSPLSFWHTTTEYTINPSNILDQHREPRVRIEVHVIQQTREERSHKMLH